MKQIDEGSRPWFILEATDRDTNKLILGMVGNGGEDDQINIISCRFRALKGYLVPTGILD